MLASCQARSPASAKIISTAKQLFIIKKKNSNIGKQKQGTATKGQSGPHIKFKAVGSQATQGVPVLREKGRKKQRKGRREEGEGKREGEGREETTSDLILSLPHPPTLRGYTLLI